MDIDEETKKLNDLRREYETAKSTYLSDSERDINRKDRKTWTVIVRERALVSASK